MSIVPYPAIVGADIGSIDENKHLDLAAAHAAGLRFFGRKASEHLYPDPDFEKDWRAAGAAGLSRIAYHFPRVHPFTVDDLIKKDARAQLAVALKVLDGAGGLADGDFPLCLDVEFPSGRLPASRAQCAMFITEFCTAYRAQRGHWPMIYSSQRVVDGSDLDALNGALAPELANCPLWVKTGYRLRARQAVDQIKPASPRLPRAWTLAPTVGAYIHQIQGDAVHMPGFSSICDVCLFMTMRAGETGPRVTRVQTLLGAPLTGVFDAATTTVVKMFQSAHGLDDDAVIGPATVARAS